MGNIQGYKIGDNRIGFLYQGERIGKEGKKHKALDKPTFLFDVAIKNEYEKRGFLGKLLDKWRYVNLNIYEIDPKTNKLSLEKVAVNVNSLVKKLNEFDPKGKWTRNKVISLAKGEDNLEKAIQGVLKKLSVTKNLFYNKWIKIESKETIAELTDTEETDEEWTKNQIFELGKMISELKLNILPRMNKKLTIKFDDIEKVDDTEKKFTTELEFSDALDYMVQKGIEDALTLFKAKNLPAVQLPDLVMKRIVANLNKIKEITTNIKNNFNEKNQNKITAKEIDYYIATCENFMRNIRRSYQMLPIYQLIQPATKFHDFLLTQFKLYLLLNETSAGNQTTSIEIALLEDDLLRLHSQFFHAFINHLDALDSENSFETNLKLLKELVSGDFSNYSFPHLASIETHQLPQMELLVGQIFSNEEFQLSLSNYLKDKSNRI